MLASKLLSLSLGTNFPSPWNPGDGIILATKIGLWTQNTGSFVLHNHMDCLMCFDISDAKSWNFCPHFFSQYLPHKCLPHYWKVDTYNKEGRWKLQVSNSKSIILLFIDNILKQIDVSHCLVKISSLKCLKSCVFIGEIFKDHLWCNTWTCKNLKS